MRSAFLQLVIVFVGSVAIAAPDSAAAHDPFTTTLRGDHDILTAIYSKAARAGDAFPSIRFQASKIHGIGRAYFFFNARKLPAAEAVLVRGTQSSKDRVVPMLLKGFVFLNRSTGEDRRVPAALSIIRGRARIQFLSEHSPRQARAARLFALSWKLTIGQSVVARVSTKQNGALLSKLCDSHTHEKAQTQSVTTPPTKLTTQARVITISTDADPEWYAIYGDASNAEIAATINAAEAIFERQLGIRFSLVRQHVYVSTSPYISPDASVLLASFKANPENPANLGFSPATFDWDVDVKHLFTGKDLAGNVIGLSYVGAICWSSKNAYGLTQNLSRELNITTFMHEVGHTLGAAHDTTDADSIMYPTLGIKRYFSPQSVQQINGMLAVNGKCIAEQLVGANLANATISLRRRFVKDGRALLISGQLLSNLGVPLPGENVALTLNKRVVMVTTKADGTFSFRLNLASVRRPRLTVFARTANGETETGKPLIVAVRV